MDIVIRKVNTDMYNGNEDSYIQQLYPARREKVKRLKYTSGKHVSIEAGLMLQEAVKSRLGIKPEDICIISGENGKPYMKDHEDFCFNISHSGDYVVLAYGDRQLGVDIEHLRQDNIREQDMRVARRCFTEAEYAYVVGDNKQDSTCAERFFEIWTMKESYLKYTGQGISVPLASFEVDPRNMSAYELKENGARTRLPVKYDMQKKYSCIITVCYGEAM